MRAAAALLVHQGKTKKKWLRFLRGQERATHQSEMQTSESISSELDQMARLVVDCAFTVHKELGPGLLESVYQACFCEELRSRNIRFEKQVEVPIKYRTLRMDSGLRLDLLVSDAIIVELKSVARIEPIFKAQVLSYLRLSGLKLGFLINFNVPLIREGILRLAL